MKRLPLLVATILLLCLVIAASAAVVDIEGDIIFVDGTTVEEAVTLLNGNGIVLVDYVVKNPHISVRDTYSAYTLEGDVTTQGVLAHYWQDFEARMRADDSFIESIDKPGSLFTKPVYWETFKVEVQTGVDEFSATINGCWDTATCPDVPIARVWASATVAELMDIADSPLVEAVGWPALLLEPFQVKAAASESEKVQQPEASSHSHLLS